MNCIKICIAFILVSIFTSCNTKKQEIKSSVDSDSTENSTVNCYAYTDNKDTVNLNLISAGNSISGTLVYNLYEKDRNIGRIKGEMKGDVLVADYIFVSEGIQSIRQVVFKKTDQSFAEGTGEVEDQNGKIVFRNIDSLRFDTSINLSEVECR